MTIVVITGTDTGAEMNETQKITRAFLDARSQVLTDLVLDTAANIIANTPLEKTPEQMRSAAVAAIRAHIIGIGD